MPAETGKTFSICYMNIKSLSFKITLIIATVAAILSTALCEVKAKPLPFVTVTVDVETISNQDRSLSISDQYDLVKDGVQFGTIEILNILEKHSAQGVFFYNVYEYWKDGDSVRNIAEFINKRGHDIELHTHPQWAYDPNKLFMHNYSYEMQEKIISSGKKMLESWTGKEIIAHRAGAYGADFNTLKALERNKIYLDSSYFYKHPWCELNTAENHFKKNYYSRFGDITEIPVNVFYLDDIPNLMPNLRPIRHITKYDINEYVEEKIIMKAIELASDLDFDVIVLFLHSYTFIDHKNNELSPALGNIRKFDRIISHMKDTGYQFVTFRDLEVFRNQKKIRYDKEDRMPVITRKINTLKYLLKIIGVTNENLFPLAMITLSIMLVPIIIIIVRKQRSGFRWNTSA